MGLSSRVGATALVSLAALSSVVNAQGFYFQDPAVCNTKFQYVGCANVEYEPFAFAPTNWDPSGTSDDSASYIDYDTGDIVNSTVSPYGCSQACEAHGYKYSALWFERSCSCASSLQIKNPDTGASLDLRTVIDATSDAKCTGKKQGGAPDPCGGDRRQNCGSDQGAQIYINPSFQNTDSLSTDSLVTGYKQLGCFKSARFPSRTYTTTQLDSPGTCFSYCANLRTPFVFMVKKSVAGILGVECHCGAGFSEDAQQAPESATCNAKCGAVLDSTTCDSGAQDCCQLVGGTAAPVYYNPKLLGCLVPVIPGRSDPLVENNIPFTAYKCFPTPADILARPITTVAYNLRTLTASASFVATASPQAIPTPYINYGCWQNTAIENIFNNVLQSNIAPNLITVEQCVTYCNSQTQPFAAIYGSGTGQKCACGDARKSGLADTTNRMQDCNQPCGGSTQQNCGGPQGPIIYAKRGQAGNNWAVQWTSTRAATPTYSCAGGPPPANTNTPPAGTDTPPAGTNTPPPAGGTNTPPAGGSTPVDIPGGTSTGAPGGSGSDAPGGTSTGAPGGSGSDAPGGTSIGGPGGSGSNNPTGSPTGSDSSNPIGTGTGSGSGATPTSTAPGVPGTTNLPTDTFVILEVAPYTPTKKRGARNQRRQSVGGFVGGAGPSNPNSCADATLFGVRRGQLLSGGQPISTSRDPVTGAIPDFISFAVDSTGTITRTFTIIDGKLHWYNDLFVDGEAHFFQANSGEVYITFNGDDLAPADSTRIDIVVYYADQCVGDDVIGSPGVNPSGTGVGPSGSGGVPTGTGDGSMPTSGSGDDEDVPEKDWYFREGHAPDNYPCTETTESWIPGETTFLPHEEL